jgi:hypothetical protein
MRKGGSLPVLGLMVGLTGCASGWERSYDRWSAYKSGGPYADWASCIEDRSRHHLDEPSTEAGNDAQIFTDVLHDCRPLMATLHWQNLSDSQMQKLIGDAYQAFSSVKADKMARLMEAIS